MPAVYEMMGTRGTILSLAACAAAVFAAAARAETVVVRTGRLLDDEGIQQQNFAKQFACMVRYGMTPLEDINRMTRVAGIIKQGQRAHPGNPR